MFAGQVKIEMFLSPVLDYDPEGSPTKYRQGWKILLTRSPWRVEILADE